MKNLGSVEKMIYQARIDNKAICEYHEKELQVQIASTILNISVICGAELPSDIDVTKLLCQQFSSFLMKFGYKEITLQEVILAFQLNCKTAVKKSSAIDIETVRFRGRFFNVEYASEVIANYMQYRYIFNRKIENFLDEN